MVQDVIYPKECSVCTLRRVYLLLLLDGMNVLSMSVKSIWSKLSFKTCVSILIFCLDDQSTDISGVLKFPTITVLLLIFFFYGIPTYSIPYQLHLPVLNFMQMNLCSVPAFWNS